ncbi:hypothetical protein DL771_009536 [Monosporascus sp. 5C6A]|nr:hypothetical protein DL771_009536 [Monosporascus sp. 5C6A]
MMFRIFFAFWRFMQIVTLIPTMGMLAYFVHGFVEENRLTPNLYLVTFIVSVIALAWALWTLFSYHHSSANAWAVGLVDLLFVGAFIGAAYSMRAMARADCAQVRAGDPTAVSFGIFGTATVNTTYGAAVDRTCAMLKACFVFDIMNAIMFFFTAVLAWMHGDRMSSDDRKSYYRETQHHRHGHRSSRSPRTTTSRSHSHSHRRAYV